MRMADWIARLQQTYPRVLDADNRSPLIRDVSGGASLTQLSAEPDRLAANRAFVAPASTTAEGAGSGNAQVVRREMLVVVALRDPTDRLGADGASDMERVVEATIQALVGWRPPNAISPVVFQRGSVLDFRAKSLWWQMLFSAKHFMEHRE